MEINSNKDIWAWTYQVLVGVSNSITSSFTRQAMNGLQTTSLIKTLQTCGFMKGLPPIPRVCLWSTTMGNKQVPNMSSEAAGTLKTTNRSLVPMVSTKKDPVICIPKVPICFIPCVNCLKMMINGDRYCALSTPHSTIKRSPQNRLKGI